MAARAADWDALKAEYATTCVSCRELAAKYGVSKSTLMKVAARDGWAEARKKHGSRVVAEATRKAERAKVDKLVRLQRSADVMAERIAGVLDDPQQFYRHFVEVGRGKGVYGTEERIFAKADTRAMRDMVAAIKDMTGAMRNLYGLLTEPERAAMEVAAARLRLDERKAGTEEGREGESGVVVLAEVEGTDGADGEG